MLDIVVKDSANQLTTGDTGMASILWTMVDTLW